MSPRETFGKVYRSFSLSQLGVLLTSSGKNPETLLSILSIQYAGQPSHQRTVQAEMSIVSLLRNPEMNPELQLEVGRLYQRVLLVKASLIPKVWTRGDLPSISGLASRPYLGSGSGELPPPSPPPPSPFLPANPGHLTRRMLSVAGAAQGPSVHRPEAPARAWAGVR